MSATYKRIWLAAIVMVVVIAGCNTKKETQTKAVFIDYEWHFFIDSTYVAAVIKDAQTGNTISLPANSSIAFNNNQLIADLRDTSAVVYRGQYSGHIPTGTFSYTDEESNIYSNPFTFMPVRNPVTPATLYRDSVNTIHWTGSASLPGDSVTCVVFTGGTFRVLAPTELTPGSTSVSLTSDSVHQLPTSYGYFNIGWFRADDLSGNTVARSLKQTFAPRQVGVMIQ